MSFEDKSITCADCGTTFTFSASEQELFAERGFTNEPKRCLSCRQARKAERGDSAGGGNSGFGGGRRQMFTATCAQCGKDAQVPFQPREGRPVYCSDCFGSVRQNRQ